MSIASRIRTIPHYPREGIMFRDITTLLQDAEGFGLMIGSLVEQYRGQPIDKVAAVEARGFILGAPLAWALGAGFVPIRKRGKLPAATLRQTYALEYGEDEVEIHLDALGRGESVLLVDDLIATGGTAEAAIKLLRQAGANVVGAAFVIDLPDLGGAARIEAHGVPVHALVRFPGH
jgi:adenine phosphoribosyltransferase